MIIVGFFLTFLPSFVNPANWNSVPETLPTQYAFVIDFVWPGLLVFIIGTVLLFYSAIEAMYRSETYYAEKRRVAFNLYKRSIIPTVVGAIVYVIVSAIQGGVMPMPQALRSAMLSFNAQGIIDIFFGGCIVAFCVGYYCYYSERIAPNSVIVRAIIYSAFALFIIAGILTLWNLNDALNYFLLRVAVDTPRFLLLGLAVGMIIQHTTISASIAPNLQDSVEDKRCFKQVLNGQGA